MPNNIIDKIQLSGVTYDIGGQGGSGVSVVEVTQAEYDALPSSAKTDTSKMYVITDAEAGDLTQYWTSAQTQSAITQATSGKVETSAITSAVTSASTDSEIPTAKAVYDAIPTGGTGGGKAISAGTNISVTTGETADTINCTIPIKVGGGSDSIGIGNNTLNNAIRVLAVGDENKIYNLSANSFVGGMRSEIKYNCPRSFAFGYEAIASAGTSFSIGSNTITKNDSELSTGRYNVSNTGSTTADKTLFSVGNGTADNARHNAFEIRQNGDIYLNDGSKLQDTVSATTANTTALGELKFVKLTQTEYDNLQTKDNNTLYVIVN